MQFAQVEGLIDAAGHVIGWDVFVQIERIEQRGPSGLMTSHHRGDLQPLFPGGLYRSQGRG